jgi:hypothetical protein
MAGGDGALRRRAVVLAVLELSLFDPKAFDFAAFAMTASFSIHAQ